MKFEEISGLSATELRKKLKTSKAELFELKMKNSLGQVSNPMSIRLLRRNIAKLMTALVSK